MAKMFSGKLINLEKETSELRQQLNEQATKMNQLIEEITAISNEHANAIKQIQTSLLTLKSDTGDASGFLSVT